MNLDKLKGKLTEKHMTYEQLAIKIGIGYRTLCYKMNSGKFTVSEAERISIALNLSFDEFLGIFFPNLVA